MTTSSRKQWLETLGHAGRPVPLGQQGAADPMKDDPNRARPSVCSANTKPIDAHAHPAPKALAEMVRSRTHEPAAPYPGEHRRAADLPEAHGPNPTPNVEPADDERDEAQAPAVDDKVLERFEQVLRGLFAFEPQVLILTPDVRVVMANDRGERVVTTKAVSKELLIAALKQVMPKAAADDIRATGRGRFAYQSSLGKAEVTVLMRNSSVQAEVRLVERTAADLHGSAPGDVEHQAHSAGEVAPSQQADLELPELIRLALDGKASDLHICSGKPPFVRQDGDLMRLADLSPLSEERVWAMLRPHIPAGRMSEFEESRDVDFAVHFPHIGRVRVNLYHERSGVGAAIRCIPDQVIPAHMLGIPDAIVELCNQRSGLILVTGPTGSGKSTTLASLVDHINTFSQRHIITIEDPIELVHKSKRCLVTQREIGTDATTFARALRAALREDPDVVLIGEMRDQETVHMALETAETGHLVLGTLHTNSATSTIDRIIDQFPASRQEQIRLMLSESLRGVLSQVLCRKMGGGRVAAFETLIVSSPVANLVRERKTYQIPSVMQTGRAQGMTTLNTSLLELLHSEQISEDEALARALPRNEMLKKIQARSQQTAPSPPPEKPAKGLALLRQRS